MIRRYLLEVIDIEPEPRTATRTTCLGCGNSTGPIIQPSKEHECHEAVGVFALAHGHWREIVRDAFLAGRDAEAIEIICHEMGLVCP